MGPNGRACACCRPFSPEGHAQPGRKRPPAELLEVAEALVAPLRRVLRLPVQLGEDGLVYNSAAFVGSDGVLAVYRKAHLWDAEKLVFTPGEAPPPVVDLPFGRAGLMICYDLEFPEWVRLAALAGADLIAAPVNWPAMPVPAGERPCDVVRVQADACVNGVIIMGACP